MRLLLPAFLALGLLACESRPADHARAAADTPPVASDPAEQPAPPARPATDPADAAPMPASPSAPQPGGYELLGIVDPGINNVVAFALKKPRGWQVQQSFTRQWKGSAPYNQIYISLRSPDGADQIEYLPATAYFFTDGPTTREMRQLAQQYGGTPPTPGELAPMPPLAYLRQILLPQLAQRGLQMRVTSAHEEPPQQKGATSTADAWLEGTLANGHRARLGCLLTLTTTPLNGEVYYNWETLPTLVQSGHDLAACYAHVAVARQSLTVNPAWAQQNQQLVSTGTRTNQDIAQRNYQIQRDAQQHQQQTFDAIRQDRQASEDRRAAAFGDALTGQARYDDPTTGERVRTTDYAHVYKDDQGHYYGSNTPVEAGQVNWQELQRVALSAY